MKKALKWLGKHKAIALLLAIITYFSIVTFHDEVTQVAIKLRNVIGRDLYNAYLAYFFIALLLGVLAWLAWHIGRGRRIWLNSSLVAITAGLLLFAFNFLMTYSIEAIHFVEYFLVALLLLPVLRSYGETVFWVTILGAIDELFQYFFLVPEFEYFDFNDIVLNLLGAGTAAIAVFAAAGGAVEIKQRRWYRSPAVVTGAGLLLLFIILLISGKMTANPTGVSDSGNWFSLNREAMPDAFWKEAYPGRRFHILRPWEGLAMMYLLFAGGFLLDNACDDKAIHV
jgi:hypothetical protein